MGIVSFDKKKLYFFFATICATDQPTKLRWDTLLSVDVIMMTTSKNQRFFLHQFFFTFTELFALTSTSFVRDTPHRILTAVFIFVSLHLLSLFFCCCWVGLAHSYVFFLLLLLLRNFSLILCFLFLYFLPSISISFSFIFFTFYVYMTFRSRFNFFLIFLIFAVCVRVYITAL